MQHLTMKHIVEQIDGQVYSCTRLYRLLQRLDHWDNPEQNNVSLEVIIDRLYRYVCKWLETIENEVRICRKVKVHYSQHGTSSPHPYADWFVYQDDAKIVSWCKQILKWIGKECPPIPYFDKLHIKFTPLINALFEKLEENEHNFFHRAVLADALEEAGYEEDANYHREVVEKYRLFLEEYKQYLIPTEKMFVLEANKDSRKSRVARRIFKAYHRCIAVIFTDDLKWNERWRITPDIECGMHPILADSIRQDAQESNTPYCVVLVLDWLRKPMHHWISIIPKSLESTAPTKREIIKRITNLAINLTNRSVGIT